MSRALLTYISLRDDDDVWDGMVLRTMARLTMVGAALIVHRLSHPAANDDRRA